MQWILLIITYIHIAQTTEYDNLSNDKSNKRTYYDVKSHENAENNPKKRQIDQTTIDYKRFIDLANFCDNVNKHIDDSKNKDIELYNPLKIENNSDSETNNVESQSCPFLNHYIFDNKEYDVFSSINDETIEDIEKCIDKNTDVILNIQNMNDNIALTSANYTEIDKIEQILNNFRIKNISQEFKNDSSILIEECDDIQNSISNNEFIQHLIKLMNFVLLNKPELLRWINSLVYNFNIGKYKNTTNINTKYNEFGMLKLSSDNMLIFYSIIENFKGSITFKDFLNNSIINPSKNELINELMNLYKNISEKMNLLHFYCTDYYNFMLKFTIDELLANIQNMQDLELKYLRLFLLKLSSLTLYKDVFNKHYKLTNHIIFAELFSLIKNVSTYFDSHYLHLQKYFNLFNVSNDYKVCLSSLNNKNHFLYYYIIDWILYFLYNHTGFNNRKFFYIKIDISLDVNSSFINLLTLMYAIIKNDNAVYLKLDDFNFINIWKSKIFNSLNFW